jgi:hypothetical protein
MSILSAIAQYRGPSALRCVVATPKRRRRTLRIEGLEDRRVPAVLSFTDPATLTDPVSGDLQYVADAGVSNDFAIEYNTATDRYTISDVEPIHYSGRPLDVVGNHTRVISFSARGIDKIMAALGTGAEALTDRATVRSVNDPLTLNAGGGDDYVDVLATALPASPVTVYGGSGNDWIQVGQRYGQPTADLDGIRAPVQVFGQEGRDTLWVSDFDNGGVTPPIYDFTPHTYGISSSWVQRDGAATTFYGSVEEVRLNAGYGNDVVNVWSTAAATEYVVSLKAGGRDTLNVGSWTGSLDTILSHVIVLGEQGVGSPPIDAVNLNDQADATINNYVVTADAVRRNGAEVLAYRNMERMTLNAGTMGDTIVVESVGTATTPTQVTVNGGLGNDRFDIGRLGSMNGIISRLNVNGQGGYDWLNFNDQAELAGHVYLLSSSAFGRSVGGYIQYNIVYSGTEDLKLYAGMASDQIYVYGTPATTSVRVNAGGGDDTIHVGYPGSVAGIRRPLTVDGQMGFDTVFVHDSADGPDTFQRRLVDIFLYETTRNGVVFMYDLNVERVDVAA